MVAALIWLATASAAQADPLVISEVLPEGPSGEFVEVFNASDSDVALAGWTVEVGGNGSECTGYSTALPDDTLPPGGHVLLGSVQGADVPWSSDMLSELIGFARVVPPGSRLTPADAVQWGDISGCGEGNRAPDPGDSSLTRRGGWQDTNDNAADFEIVAATPQNLNSPLTPKNPPPPPPPPPPPSDEPAPPTTGSSEPPAETPPPAGPAIDSGAFTEPPVAGKPATLVIEARDLLTGVSGVELDFGDAGRLGMSACQSPVADTVFRPGQQVRFEVPHTFSKPGTYTVSLTVRAGACGILPRSTTQQLQVVVGAVKKRGKSKANASAAARKCAAGLVVSSRAKRAASKAILCLMNAERTARGLKKLKPSKKLMKIAKRHNADMLKRRYFLHEHPSGPTLLDRMTRAKYVGFMGENLGYFSNSTTRDAMAAWMASPLHKANVLQPRFRYAAVAVSMGSPSQPGPPRSTMTVNFGDKRK